MPIEFHKQDGQLVWVRSPFTGTVTYFTDVHKKRSGFVRQPARGLPDTQPRTFTSGETERRAVEAALAECPFCPGNEHLTTEEILRVTPGEVPDAVSTESPWLIRAFRNIVPRIPECCTGGRNESYVVVEDPRHFAQGARHHEDLVYSALLPRQQFQALIRADVAVVRRSYENPAVRAVLIRKNQGRESGASQPHAHNQVIGADQPFAWVVRESTCLAREPDLWNEIVAFAAAEGFLIERQGACVLYFCPFGRFPRSYDVVCLDAWEPITHVAPERLDQFSALLHHALTILGPLPLDYEIHDGPGVPLHAHVSGRHFPYSNIGGTLNLPSTILGGR